jgi:DNA-binding response OmpR family regulator
MAVLKSRERTLPPYEDKHLSVSFDDRLVLLDGQPVLLRKKEYDLLSLLVRHAGQVVPRSVLLFQVWGYSSSVKTRTLDVHVRRLRKKLGSRAEIETVFGVGYRFQPFSAPRYAPSVASANSAFAGA